MPGTSHGSLSPDAILTDLRELVECEPPSSDRCGGAHADHECVVVDRLLDHTMPVREPAAEPLEGEA
ncbi:hypothetical protein [Microbispora rosea]|uniref:hypothetical protein n=1 Tax=Microbispora rosea TaxID=58117 RepID=UPI00341C1C70